MTGRGTSVLSCAISDCSIYSKYPLMIRKFWKFLKRLVALFIVASVLSVVAFKFLPVPLTPLMLIRCGEQMANGKDLKLKHSWRSLDEISIYMPSALWANEDQLFLQHHGFDVKQIKKAMKEKREDHRGASTISQQTAKNLFLWPARSYIRKGFEAYFTVLLELFWTKERIMEVYVNSIEFGDGIYGAQAAAQHFFHKDASQLTREECIRLAAVVPGPLNRDPLNPDKRVRRLMRHIDRQMKNVGLFPLKRQN